MKIHNFPNSTARRDLHNTTGWLSDLANLTAGTIPLPDAKAKLASIASALVEEYPPAAFTRQSLMAVARDCKFFPSYSELCRSLSKWWRENQPQRPALPAPKPYQHVETPKRTRPTTEGLQTIASVVAGNAAVLHAQYAALYHRVPEQAAPQPRPAPQLSRERLNADYAQAGIRGPKVAS